MAGIGLTLAAPLLQAYKPGPNVCSNPALHRSSHLTKPLRCQPQQRQHRRLATLDLAVESCKEHHPASPPPRRAPPPSAHRPPGDAPTREAGEAANGDLGSGPSRARSHGTHGEPPTMTDKILQTTRQHSSQLTQRYDPLLCTAGSGTVPCHSRATKGSQRRSTGVTPDLTEVGRRSRPG